MVDRIELRTERLLLRPFAPAGADDVLAYAADEEWGRYLPLPHPYTRQHAQEFVARAIQDSQQTIPTFAICSGQARRGRHQPQRRFREPARRARLLACARTLGPWADSRGRARCDGLGL